MVEGALGGAVVAAVVAAGGWWAKSYLEALAKGMAEAHTQAERVARNVEAQEKVLDKLVAQTAALEGAKLTARMEGLQHIVEERFRTQEAVEQARSEAETRRALRDLRIRAYYGYLVSVRGLAEHAARNLTDFFERPDVFEDEPNPWDVFFDKHVVRVNHATGLLLIAGSELVVRAHTHHISDRIDRLRPGVSFDGFRHAVQDLINGLHEMTAAIRSEMGHPVQEQRPPATSVEAPPPPE